MSAKVFPMLMMIGMIVLMTTLVIAIVVAKISYGSCNHSIVTGLNPAIKACQLLGSLSTIKPVNAWLGSFTFVGMAFLITGIGLEHCQASSAYCDGSPSDCGTS